VSFGTERRLLTGPRIRRAREFFARNARAELRGVLTGPYPGRRRALLHDIDLLARMAGTSKGQADAVLEAYGVEIMPPGSAQSSSDGSEASFSASGRRAAGRRPRPPAARAGACS